MLTAGCVSRSSRAAREKLPCRATASSVWRCASWTFMDLQKYLIVMIMTIDFADARVRAIIAGVDMNHYVVELMARERLDCARAHTARRRLLRGREAAPGLTAT